MNTEQLRTAALNDATNFTTDARTRHLYRDAAVYSFTDANGVNRRFVLRGRERELIEHLRCKPMFVSKTNKLDVFKLQTIQKFPIATYKYRDANAGLNVAVYAITTRINCEGSYLKPEEWLARMQEADDYVHLPADASRWQSPAERFRAVADNWSPGVSVPMAHV